MVSTPSPAPAPDPVATAQAQSTANRETAVTQYGLNATNQYTPQGSLTYTQNGTWADGTPRFESTQSLNSGEQGIYDTGLETRQNVANIGRDQSARIGNLLNTPYSSTAATDNKLAQMQRGFLDPQWDRQQQSQEADLINRGIRPGSEAYRNAQTDFSTNRQRAYDQMYLDAYKTAEGSALTDRNQPINEISALQSGSQVSNPSWMGQTNVGVAPTDVIGAQQQSLNQQNVGYNAQMAQNNALIGGVSNIAGMGLGGWMRSDINSKEDIEVVGERPDGLHVIDFNYKPGMGEDTAPRHRGLIAQEVKQVYPHATAADRRGLLVDYNRVPGAKGLMTPIPRAA